MPVRIIADSGCDLTSSAHPQLTVVPLAVVFGTTVYSDRVDLSPERFYELLVESGELPTTGQVTPYDFEQAGRAALAAGEDVVYLTLSSKLSGTHQGAVAAAAALEEDARAAGRTVRVVDTLNATVGEKILVEYALRLVDEGKAANEVADALEQARERVVLVALLDTLEYLKRGGRISAATATIGEMLSFKPVVGVRDGEVVMLGKARGSKNGRNLFNEEIKRTGGIDFSMPATVGYTGLSDKLLFKYLRDHKHAWEDYFTEETLPITHVGPTIGTHVGPGAIAVAYFEAKME